MGGNLIITQRGNLPDPAVLVIDLKWLRKLLNYDDTLFDFFVSSLFSTDPWKTPTAKDSHNYSDEELDNLFGSAHNANVDLKLKWLSTMQEIVTDHWGRKDWDWLTNNVPSTVFDGWDMAIGEDKSGKMMKNLLENTEGDPDQLIIITSYPDVIRALTGADKDFTMRFILAEDGDDEGLVIEPFIYINNNLGMRSMSDIGEDGTTLIPKALYRLANLSDVEIGFRAAINYMLIR